MGVSANVCHTYKKGRKDVLLHLWNQGCGVAVVEGERGEKEVEEQVKRRERGPSIATDRSFVSHLSLSFIVPLSLSRIGPRSKRVRCRRHCRETQSLALRLHQRIPNSSERRSRTHWANHTLMPRSSIARLSCSAPPAVARPSSCASMPPTW